MFKWCFAGIHVSNIFFLQNGKSSSTEVASFKKGSCKNICLWYIGKFALRRLYRLLWINIHFKWNLQCGVGWIFLKQRIQFLQNCTGNMIKSSLGVLPQFRVLIIFQKISFWVTLFTFLLLSLTVSFPSEKVTYYFFNFSVLREI